MTERFCFECGRQTNVISVREGLACPTCGTIVDSLQDSNSVPRGVE